MNRMAILRRLANVLLIWLIIGGSLLFPVFPTHAQYSGSEYLNVIQASNKPYSNDIRGISDVVPASAEAALVAPAIVDDAVILLDVTGSMRGEGPDPRASDIWDKTVAAVLDIVDRLAPNTNVALVPFSNGPEWPYINPGPLQRGGQLTPQPLTAASEREAVKAHLVKLVADGEATWLYESLEYSLTQLRQWREADPGRLHRQSLFLYTDGIDNGPHGNLGIEGIVQLLRTHRGDYRDLYFVYNDLAGQLSPEQKKLLTDNGVTVTVGPPTSNVELVTENLEFGKLSAESSVSQSIFFRSGFGDVWGQQVRLRFEIQGSSVPVAVAAETVPLQDQVQVALRPTGLLPGGTHQARLIVEPVDGGFNLIPRNTIEVTFSSVAPPTPTAVPLPVVTLTVVQPPRGSLIGGVPDLLLFLGIVVLVLAGAVVSMWQYQLWMFKCPGQTTQLIWRRGEDPTTANWEAIGVRTIQPGKSKSTEDWVIGIGSYISLPDDGAVKPVHAKIAYGGKKRPGFRLIPVEGEVRADGRAVPADGIMLADGSSFVIGPYHFRFELVAETGVLLDLRRRETAVHEDGGSRDVAAGS